MAILFDGRFANRSTFSGYGLQANGVDSTGNSLPAGVSGRLEIVTDPARSGERVVKHTLYPTDIETATGLRSEYYYQPAGSLPKTLWYWFALYMPDTWDTDKRFVVWQLHDTPDGGDSSTRTPTMVGYLDADRKIYVPNSYDTVASSPAHPNYDRTPLVVKPTFGRWQEWVVKVNWSAVAGAGSFDVWVDRRKVYWESSQINTYNDAALPHVKQGPYDYYHLGDFGVREMYSKGVLVSDTAHANFTAFMAEAGWSSKTELEQVTPVPLSMG